MRRELLVAATLVLTLVSVSSATRAVIENWSRQAPGRRGIPSGWTEYTTFGGRPAYDFFVTEDEGHRALRVASHDEHCGPHHGGCAVVHGRYCQPCAWHGLAHGGGLRWRPTLVFA